MIFKKVGVISFKENAGKVVKLHPRFTLIKGDNTVGKTSLVRCLLHPLGVDFSAHPRWKDAQPKVLLEAEVDDKRYHFYRDWGGNVSVYREGECIGRDLSITRQLSPLLAEILEFNLHLTSKKKFIQATPAFKLLPYYIDQKNGWTRDYQGFEKLSQFQNWQDAYFQYHSGIQSNEYYRLKCKINDLDVSLADQKGKLNDLLLVKRKLDEAGKSIDESKDISLLKQEINDLISLSSEYNEKISKFKKKYYTLYNKRNEAQSCLTVVNSRINEIRADLKFATENDGEFPCPTCGALYDNSLASRFSFSEDLSYCLERSSELKEAIFHLNSKIIKIENDSIILRQELQQIHKKIDTRNKDFSMREYLEEEGRRFYLQTFYSEISECSDVVDEYDKMKKEAQKNLKNAQDAQKTQTIKKYYYDNINSLGISLDVEIPDQVASKIYCAISEEGSLHTRLVLAKKIALLQTNFKFSDSIPCPLVVDTPNQQDQDKGNMNKILSTIRDYTPPNLQVILALRKTYDVEFSGSVIELHNKKSLLNVDEFDEALDFFAPYLS